MKPPECSWAALGKVPLSLGTWCPSSSTYGPGSPHRAFRPVHRWWRFGAAQHRELVWEKEKVLCGLVLSSKTPGLAWLPDDRTQLRGEALTGQ